MPGCSGDEDLLTVDVQGEITWNGRPLRKGYIVFDSEDGAGIPSQGLILDGKYNFKACPGPKIVRIHANRTYEEVGENPQRLPIAYIPFKYNSQSTLKANVVPGEDNTFSFDLHEK
jgi:hypothetical protein